MQNKIKLSIVVPCYNEAKNIPLILERFAANIQRDDIEIILVDNGSKDDSSQVLSQHLPAYPFARSIKVEVNQGYGFGITSGLKVAQGTYIGWTHADMQTDPKDCIKALDVILGQGDQSVNTYAKGLRKGRSISDTVFTVGMSVFESIYLSKRLWDINAQPNVFHRDFFATWQDAPNDFSLDLYALYKAREQKLNVIRFPVIFPQRLHGTSTWNTGIKSKVKFIKRTLDFSKKLKKRLA